jgi:arabinan endo-1,5-alpha-L-arabinosidase
MRMRLRRGRAALAAMAPLTVAVVLAGGTAGLATAPGSAASHSARSGTAAGAGAAGRAEAASRARTTGSVPQPYTYIHDPSMAREGNTYYVFSTGDPAGTIGNGNIQIRTSHNLRSWQYTGTVFAQQPAWITSALGSIPNLWAPDISYFGGLWHLYYAGSSFGSNNSVIGLATTPTLDPRSLKYHWTDDGLVFRTTTADDDNAIDPSLVTDAAGNKWLSFGSFWSGIKLLRLDNTTGKPASSSPTVYSLAEKASPDPLEGSGIVYHGGYYYLFMAVDYCCRGISSTYHIQVGRSASITGPYLDASGTALLSGGGMEVQGTDAGMIGPGSPFVFGRGAGGPSSPLLVYHYYDAYDSGDAWIQIRPLIWVDGWPVTGNPMVPVPGESAPPSS